MIPPVMLDPEHLAEVFTTLIDNSLSYRVAPIVTVVVLTTSEVERDVLASYQLGASGYLTKPIDYESLFAAIRGIEEYWFAIVRRPGVS